LFGDPDERSHPVVNGLKRHRGEINSVLGSLADATWQSVPVRVRIPVEETERRVYVEQFLAVLSRSPGQTPEMVRQARQLMLHSDQLDRPSYIDNMLPNRLGTYEVVCRYQSQNPGFWPKALEAPPLRFEYIRTMNWIDVFNRKTETPK
jgi:hypothetical protein